MVKQEESDLIKETEDSHGDEEHISPPQDEDEDEGDAGNVTEEGQGGADQGQGELEEQQTNDPEGQMAGQLAPVVQAQQDIRSYAQ